MRPRTGWTRRIAARPSWKSILRPGSPECLPRACAIPTEWPGSRKPGVLWTVVNERDELGSDLVPDYLTSVKDGGFYGWPFSYYGQHVDTRVEPQRPDLVAKAIVPDYALGSHTASLGLTFSEGTSLPERYRNGAFVGQHGSWNRKPRSGYKVIFVPFAAGRPAGQPVDVLTGFINAEREAFGRPVGVAIDRSRQLAGRRRCRQRRLARGSRAREGGNGELTSGPGPDGPPIRPWIELTLLGQPLAAPARTLVGFDFPPP